MSDNRKTWYKYDPLNPEAGKKTGCVTVRKATCPDGFHANEVQAKAVAEAANMGKKVMGVDFAKEGESDKSVEVQVQPDLCVPDTDENHRPAEAANHPVQSPTVDQMQKSIQLMESFGSAMSRIGTDEFTVDLLKVDMADFEVRIMAALGTEEGRRMVEMIGKAQVKARDNADIAKPIRFAIENGELVGKVHKETLKESLIRMAQQSPVERRDWKVEDGVAKWEGFTLMPPEPKGQSLHIKVKSDIGEGIIVGYGNTLVFPTFIKGVQKNTLQRIVREWVAFCARAIRGGAKL